MPGPGGTPGRPGGAPPGESPGPGRSACGSGVPGPACPRLLVLTDRAQLPSGRTLRDQVAAGVEAGLRWVCLRERDLPADDRAELATELAELLHPVGGLLVAAAPAPESLGGGTIDGVHLRAHDPAPDGLRSQPRLTGRSCHDTAELRRAAAERLDYVTLSPYAETRSKPGYGPALGAAGVRAALAGAGWAADGAPRPGVLALGGISPDTAAEAVDAGAHGVAVMGEVMRAEDPADVLRRLLAALPD
ncbi:thiamine phosphate synthase [Arsenicicoccus dermatophilus]|uniref:thiamine phosphate synthase n=1 Tax=Arsenicicoccus dermatophilus TaxID=1076331 RepID=UPI001F4CF47C|nr:thiamine phosphate synthase [Arsenicicoccus dermatophilus]MCH8612027.1 thiamine phosphate synthase [Arsenicicoccus dermatophilus]